MEDLNKNQIVLLTLLVSFVTSIATGIMTVSLLQEAPIEVTRNINRIVEKTIETVTPGIVTAPEKEVTTVIVKEEDLVLDSINKNTKSIVRIKEKDTLTGLSSFYGIGLIINTDGVIATDRKTITTENIYTAIANDGTELSLIPLGIDKQTNFILFKGSLPLPEKTTNTKTETKDTKTSFVFVPATFGDTDPKLGQTVIGLGGDTVNAITVGRIISFDMKDVTVGSSTVKSLIGIDTDLVVKDLVTGSPVFNLSGDVVGIKLTNDASRSFTPVSVLRKEITLLTEVPKETPKAP